MNTRTFGFEVLLLSLISFYSCSDGSVANSDIDKFISQYDTVNFNEIKGISIIQRGGTLLETNYVIDRFNSNKPPYFVTFNFINQSITKIDRSQLQRDNVSDYLTETELTNSINTIRKYDFYLLSVDSLENVFINPYYADEPAYFLRLKTPTGHSIVKKGYVYILYKDNWYLNKRD